MWFLGDWGFSLNNICKMYIFLIFISLPVWFLTKFEVSYSNFPWDKTSAENYILVMPSRYKCIDVLFHFGIQSNWIHHGTLGINIPLLHNQIRSIIASAFWFLTPLCQQIRSAPITDTGLLLSVILLVDLFYFINLLFSKYKILIFKI